MNKQTAFLAALMSSSAALADSFGTFDDHKKLPNQMIIEAETMTLPPESVSLS